MNLKIMRKADVLIPKYGISKKIEWRKIMNRQQQRKQLEEALEVMNLDNYLAFASIFAQDIHYPDLKKLIMDYFESLKNYKEYATFVWDMVELSNQLKNEIH